jgi:hypothetical protein
MRVTARLASGTADISLSAARRDTSTRIASSAVRMVAPRGRPEMRPTSPKMEPCPIGTVMLRSLGLISTRTLPVAMAKSDEPGALRSNTIAPAG